MRRHTLFAAAFLSLALCAPAHAAQPGLNLQALHLDGVVRDVALPLVGNLVGGLGPLPALEILDVVDGVVPGLVSDVAIPLVGALLGGGLPELPPLEGLEGLEDVVTGVIADVALPAVGGLVGAVH